MFHHWFIDNSYEYERILDFDTTREILKQCLEELDSMKFKQVIVTRCFIEDEDEVIRSIPCTGIEAEDEDGNIKREYADDWECSSVFIPEGYFDEYKYNALIRLRDCLFNIICDTDFDNEFILYNGGW